MRNMTGKNRIVDTMDRLRAMYERGINTRSST